MKQNILKCIVRLTLLLFVLDVSAKESRKEQIVYEYKKYEKFELDDLVIEGESGSPGDLGIDPRNKTRFKNKLPYRKNFKKEIRKAIYRIR